MTLIFTEIQEKPQNSIVYTTGEFYESGINFWTVKYAKILPNKSINIFINYRLSLITIVLLPLREHTLSMKALSSVS